MKFSNLVFWFFWAISAFIGIPIALIARTFPVLEWIGISISLFSLCVGVLLALVCESLWEAEE